MLVLSNHSIFAHSQVEIAKTYDVDYESNLLITNDINTGGDLGGGGSGGCGNAMVPNPEQQLIDFEPHADHGLPQLPEGFGGSEQPWKHAEASGGVAPYPEDSPFPNSDPVPPPVPTQGPVPHDPAAYFGE